MDDLCHKSAWQRQKDAANRKLSASTTFIGKGLDPLHRTKKSVSKTVEESSSSDDEKKKPKHRRSRIRQARIRKQVEIPVEESEFEELVDAAAEKGMGEVARVLAAHARKVAHDNTKGILDIKKSLVSILPKSDRIPGYHMYYVPAKRELRKAVLAATGSLGKQMKGIRSNWKPFSNMEMDEKWKQQNETLKALAHDAEKQAGYGDNVYEKAEAKHLVRPNTLATHRHKLVEAELERQGGRQPDFRDQKKNKRKKGISLRAVGILSNLQTDDLSKSKADNSESDHYDDHYVGADSVGGILRSEGDKMGDYFGEIQSNPEPFGKVRRLRHGLGQMCKVNGSLCVGEWVSNELKGFAIEIRQDGSYGIGQVEILKSPLRIASTI